MEKSLSLLYKGTLIFFVVATHVLGVLAFLVHRENRELNGRVTHAETELLHSETALNRTTEQLSLLKELIGHDVDIVVIPGDEQNPDSLVGAIHADIALAGDDLETKTMSAAIRKLATDQGENP